MHMSMNSWKIGALVGMAGVLCVVAFLSFKSESDNKTTKGGGTAEVDRGGKGVRQGERPKKRIKGHRSEVVRAGETKKAKRRPTFALDDDDEAKLNAEQRKTIAAIRAALDAEDRPRVLKLVQALQASDEWPDGIPKSIKMAAIEAMGWFGSSCLPEIAGFLGDSDPEVVQSAIEKYQDALADFELSDKERSRILIEASKVIDDADAMDSMLFELNNMSHATAAATIKEMWTSANDATKSVLQDAVDFLTGEEDIKTPEKLDKWLEENPDDTDDEESNSSSKNSGK